MNTAQEIASLIKGRAKANGISTTKMLEDCQLNKNTLSSMQSRGSMPKTDTVGKIAEYLDCSVDYLLGRTDLTDVFPIKSKTPTTVHKKLNISELFDQKDPLKKYISRLWEAQNEIFFVNNLLNNMIMYKPFEDNDWIVVFKYIIVVLCSAAQLLFFKCDDKSEQIENLFKKPMISSRYQEFKDFYEASRTFIEKTRHLVAHFDHTRDSDLYSKFIARQTDYDFYLKAYVLTDDRMYANIIIDLYNEEYGDQGSRDIALTKIITLFAELTKKEHQLLLEILWDFYGENKVFSDAELQKCIDKNDIKYNSENVNIGVVNDNNVINNGIINHSHVPVTIVNGSERKLSDQESALIDIFNKLDVVKQSRLIAFADELEKE